MVLVRIVSLYNLVLFIKNFTPFPKKETKGEVLKNIGNHCSRLSRVCGEIEELINSNKLDYLTKDENEILNTYLEDAFGELNRLIRGIKNSALLSVIKNNLNSVENIKDMINSLEVRDN